MSRKVAPTTVSLFSGAGGMDVGLERAGWRTVVATDIDPDCVETLLASRAEGFAVLGRPGRKYLEDANIVLGDACELSARDLRPKGASGRWRPALLAGGPPCQPWSSAGLQRGLDDPRGQLLREMVRLTDELRPHFVLFENVRGLVTAVGPRGRPGEVLEMIQSDFENVGYATSFATVNAADHGAAQRRVRLMMIATVDHELPAFPTPTHAKEPDDRLFESRKPWVSLGELLAALPTPRPGDVVVPSGARAAELAALEPGTGLKAHGAVEANRPGGHWGYRQDCFLADLELPSRTIRAASTPDWVRLRDGSLRRLTWRECAALQGFPPEWCFAGTVASRFRQIGNAVQADVACALGEALLAALERGPSRTPPESAPWPEYFERRIRYTASEHRVNAVHRVRVRAAKS